MKLWSFKDCIVSDPCWVYIGMSLPLTIEGLFFYNPSETMVLLLQRNTVDFVITCTNFAVDELHTFTAIPLLIRTFPVNTIFGPSV